MTEKKFTIKDLEKKRGSLISGKVIRSLRRCQDMTLGQLVKKTNLSHSSLSNFELGKSIVGLKHIKKIAKAIGYSDAVLVELAVNEMLKKHKFNFKMKLVFDGEKE
jgi:transcriptional regulator with XRE-family HTH domain